MNLLLAAATTTTTVHPMSAAFLWVFGLILWLVVILAFWQVFVKAGRPGWAAIIPIYNIYVLLKIAGRPGWWLLLYIIPVVNWVVSLVVAIDVAKAFGKTSLFGVVGLWFFSVIGYMILGYGDATYHGPLTTGGPTAPATV
jgi:hypothetical protein